MIGLLRGTLLEKTPDALLLDVGGVGYEVSVPMSSLCALPAEGEHATLYVHTHVREDAIRLFGFASLFDRKVFEALVSVTNVGPRLALQLLGPLDGVELCQAITEGRAPLLVSIPGVGAKTAERLILELKPKLLKLLALRSLYEGAFSGDRSEARFERTGPRHGASGIGASGTQNASAAQGADAGADARPATLFHDETGAAKAASEGKGTKAGKNAREARALEERIAARRVLEELRSGLENIGYKEKQIEGVLKEFEARLRRGEHVTLEGALRESLRSLSGHLIKEKEGE